MIYGYINTFSCQIMCGTGEVFPSPTRFIAKYRSINAHPNNDIIFCKTGESLGKARSRGACNSNKNSKYSTNNKTYKGPRGSHSLEKGPKPTRGRQLSLLTELTCKLKAGGKDAVGVLNTATGMIILDMKTGKMCTPGEWCIQVKAARLNPNKGCKDCKSIQTYPKSLPHFAKQAQASQSRKNLGKLLEAACRSNLHQN